MLSSMTGFGRASLAAPFGKLIVEVQSVNRKYLEIFTVLPKEFTRFEPEVRKWVSENALRGQITIRVHFSPNIDSLSSSLPDSNTLRGLKSAWEQIAEEAGFDRSQIDLPFVMLYFPVQPKTDWIDDENLESFRSCVLHALEELNKMRKKEGSALALDLASRLKILEKTTSAIEDLVPQSAQRMKEKLRERMENFFKQEDDFEGKLFHEAALFAEKIDITEEIIRLKSHFVQFEEILKTQGSAVGRKMDFLVQEIGREMNTIGSKSLEANISYLVVEMKSELEKMREQIQNIE